MDPQAGHPSVDGGGADRLAVENTLQQRGLGQFVHLLDANQQNPLLIVTDTAEVAALGFVALLLLRQREDNRAAPLNEATRPGVCRRRLQTALRLRPRRALSSVGAKAQPGVFPFPVPTDPIGRGIWESGMAGLIR